MNRVNRHLEATVFGTDLDAHAIDTARIGQYPDGIAVDVTPERLKRYFTRDDSTFHIRKEIRELAVFAQQNVIRDPPFTKLDVLSCRNLLIYLNADLQKKLLPIFHYALKPDGLLFMGPSETIGTFSDLFEPLDKRWNIYRRRESITAIRGLPEMPAQPFAAEGRDASIATTAPAARGTNISNVLERLLLGRFAPASVVVNERGDIIYIHGRTGAYLEPSEGQPRSNVVEMAREGLQIELPAAMRKCAASSKDVLRERVQVKTNGDYAPTDVSVTKLTTPESVRDLLLITFRPTASVMTAKAAGGKSRKKKKGEDGRIEQLERELLYIKESHQTALEELQTSNEELKSTNEELQSTNEELQSTNEELETSKEEMQSLNEELTTLNAELQSKLDDLSDSNNDMQNLLNSTDIATVFLDHELNIRRFTEQATELIRLRQTDIGRPLSELASTLEQDTLLKDCRDVLRTLAFCEREVHTVDDTTWLMRIMPYRTTENVIDGLVLTFVNIDSLKEAKRNLHRMSKVFQDALDPTIIVDLQDQVVDLNHGAVKTYGFTREELLGRPIQQVVPELQQDETAQLLARCRSGETIRNVRCERVAKKGDVSPVLLSLALLTNEDGEPDAIAMNARQMND